MVVAAAVLGCAVLVGCLALLGFDRFLRPGRAPAVDAAGTRPLDAPGAPPRTAAPAGAASQATPSTGIPPTGATVATGVGRPGAVRSRGTAARDGPYGDLRSAAVARDVVRQLVDRRAREVTGRPGREGAATTLPGSPAAVADAAARRSLLTAGLSYRRLRMSARDVAVVAAGADRAVVLVTTEASGYDVVDERGVVRSRVPPSRESPTLLHLVLTAQGWRVVTVTAP